jgi:Fe-S cluster assembly ATP-binding protein
MCTAFLGSSTASGEKMLEIKNLHVEVEGQPILKGVTLKFEDGVITSLMGPNGSGKSTLANTLMGHPKYVITEGKIILDGEDITELAPDERAKKGLFLSFQYPAEIPGVTIANVMKTALNSVREKPIPFPEFKALLQEKMDVLNMDKKYMMRYLNDGFSGGEKKRTEILQLLMLDPKIAIMDETDSGLDIDALRVVSKGVNTFMRPEKSILIITHYKRILELIKPDRMYIMIDGKIALEGSGELVDQLEEKGYGWIEKQ